MPGWFSRSKDPPAEELSCSFCNRSRAEVQFLVAAPGASICENCVQICIRVVEQDNPGLGLMRHAAEELALTFEEPSRARLFLAAALELSAVDEAATREFGHWAMARAQPHAGLRALQRIDAERRTPTDWIALSFGHSELGEYAESRRMIDAFEPIEAVDRAYVDHTHVALELRTQELDEARCDQLLRTLEGVEASLGPHSFIASNRAELLVRTGRLDEAEAQLETIPADDRYICHASFVRGQLCERRGDLQGARRAYARGCADDLDGPLARICRARST